MRLFPFLAILCPFFGFSQVENSDLATTIRQLSVDPVMKYGQLGVSVKSIKTGKVIMSENDLKCMVPASNLKLMTTAAALGILGEGYTFQTRLEYEGFIKDSVLKGNLYVTGGGDPSLGSDRFKGYPDWEGLLSSWVKKTREAGIKRIEGFLIIDASYFDLNAIPDHWPWGDLGNYYGAGVYGLNLNENMYRLFFKGNLPNDSAQFLKTSPLLKGVSYVNMVKAGAVGSGDNAYVYAAPRTPFVYMTGTIPAKTEMFAVRGAIPNPPLACGNLFEEKLKDNKIMLDSGVLVLWQKLLSNKPRILLYSYSSPPLKELVKQTNVNSINLYAEALLKACGLKKYNDPTTEQGVKAIQEFWKTKGLDITGWFMKDGSGLSPNNGISPLLMTSALSLIAKDSVFNSFYASMPIAGQTGTVYRIGKGTAAEGNMRVKSGTLSKVICYSGYFKSKSGVMHSFSIMANNYNCSNGAIIAKLEKIMVKMAEMP